MGTVASGAHSMRREYQITEKGSDLKAIGIAPTEWGDKRVEPGRGRPVSGNAAGDGFFRC